MRDGRADHRHLHHVFLGRLDALADGIRDRPRLTDTGADEALAVAYYHESAPAHGAAALVRFLDLIRADHTLFQIQRIRKDLCHSVLPICVWSVGAGEYWSSVASVLQYSITPTLLEFQSAFSCCVGQLL